MQLKLNNNEIKHNELQESKKFSVSINCIRNFYMKSSHLNIHFYYEWIKYCVLSKAPKFSRAYCPCFGKKCEMCPISPLLRAIARICIAPSRSLDRYRRNLSSLLPQTRFHTPENPARFAENADLEILNSDRLFFFASGVCTWQRWMCITGVVLEIWMYCGVENIWGESRKTKIKATVINNTYKSCLQMKGD